jgi:methyl-accepting chemotaxis protein
MANMKIGMRPRCSCQRLPMAEPQQLAQERASIARAGTETAKGLALLEAAGIQVRQEYAAARDALLAIEAAVSGFRLRQGPAVLAARPAPAVPRLLA